MLKNKTFSLLVAVLAALLVCLCIFARNAASQAARVQDGVLRFHIVANSDSAADQQLKWKVRDGIAVLTDELFAEAENKARAIEIATENRHRLEQEITSILRQNGSNQTARVEIKNLYFPTKQYENVTFPAGNYDAIHITLGEGNGENFWCVLFPALCVPSVSTDNRELLSGVLDESSVDLVTKPYTFKFKVAEWFGKIKNWFN